MSERSRVTQQAGRTKEAAAASAATYLASGHRIPYAGPPLSVGFRKSSLHSTYYVSLSLALPPRSRSAAAEASPHYTRLRPGSERGRKAHRSGAGTRECALGLKDDVAAGSSGRRIASLSLRPHSSRAAATGLFASRRARPCVARPLVVYLSPSASSIAVDATAHESLRARACVVRARRIARPRRPTAMQVCTDSRGRPRPFQLECMSSVLFWNCVVMMGSQPQGSRRVISISYRAHRM